MVVTIEKRIDDIGVIYSGSTPSTAKSSFWDGDIVWVTPNDLSRLKTPYLTTSIKNITQQGLENCSAVIVPSGSIIISSRAPIGYLAIASVECCTNQGCKSIALHSQYNSDYVYYNLFFNIDKVKNLGEGTTFAEISKTALSKIEIPFILDTTVQTQIATVLSTVDRAIAETEALIAKQQRIKTGLMQDLLTKGIDENGNIRSEATHRFKDSPLGRIPEEWEVGQLNDVVSSIDAGKSPDCPDIPAGSGEWGVLKVSAVHPGGFRDRENKVVYNKTFINPEYEVRDQDFLITRANTPELVGLTCLVIQPPEKIMLSDKTLRLNLNDSLVCKRFLSTIMQMPMIRRQIELNATGSSAGMKNISQSAIKARVIAS